MSLLFSQEIKDKLAQELHTAISQVHIVSAYCKYNAMAFVEDYINDTVTQKKLLVRFSFNDIVSGATDLSIYEFCIEHGWDMYIRLDLHAKTYIFDKLRCIVGSANATSRGIGLSNNSNYEIAHLTEISSVEMQKIDNLFSSAVLMTDDIYHKMKKCLESKTMGDISESDNWDEDILRIFTPKVNVATITNIDANHLPILENERKVYTVYEIQDILGIGLSTAYKLIKANQFHSVKVGQRVMVSKKSFDEWLGI